MDLAPRLEIPSQQSRRPCPHCGELGVGRIVLHSTPHGEAAYDAECASCVRRWIEREDAGLIVQR